MPKKVVKKEIVEPKILRKNELVELIQQKDSDLLKKDVEKVLKLLPEVISEQLIAGNKIAINQFGTFEKVEKAEREGRNPTTGAKIKIPARKSMHFKVSKTYNDRINEAK